MSRSQSLPGRFPSQGDPGCSAVAERKAALHLCDSPTSIRTTASGLSPLPLHHSDSNRHDSPGAAVLALTLKWHTNLPTQPYSQKNMQPCISHGILYLCLSGRQEEKVGFQFGGGVRHSRPINYF